MKVPEKPPKTMADFSRELGEAMSKLDDQRGFSFQEATPLLREEEEPSSLPYTRLQVLTPPSTRPSLAAQRIIGPGLRVMEDTC